MRYQSKPYRSISYNQPGLRDSKENKQNNNVSNLPASKPLRAKEYDLPCKLKMQHKISDSTNYSTTINKETLGQDLKRQYTDLVGKDYSNDILGHLCKKAQRQTDILLKHQISSALRSKMVDWMIEVLSSYRMSEETFFKSIYFMDAYLKNKKTKLEVKDLHLIGVTAMFAAAKYEEIHPLKLAVVYEKIARKKFKKTEILEMESEMVETLEFKLESPSIYDIARHTMQEMKLTFSEQSTKYLAKILLYLSKMVLFNSQLAEQSPKLLAGAVVFISLKTLQQMDSTTEPQRKLPEICDFVLSQQQKVIEVSRKVLELAKNFSKYFPTLTNLKKFNKFEYGSD